VTIGSLDADRNRDSPSAPTVSALPASLDIEEVRLLGPVTPD
jgi:hypothetical protein